MLLNALLAAPDRSAPALDALFPRTTSFGRADIDERPEPVPADPETASFARIFSEVAEQTPSAQTPYAPIPAAQAPADSPPAGPLVDALRDALHRLDDGSREDGLQAALRKLLAALGGDPSGAAAGTGGSAGLHRTAAPAAAGPAGPLGRLEEALRSLLKEKGWREESSRPLRLLLAEALRRLEAGSALVGRARRPKGAASGRPSRAPAEEAGQRASRRDTPARGLAALEPTAAGRLPAEQPAGPGASAPAVPVTAAGQTASAPKAPARPPSAAVAAGRVPAGVAGAGPSGPSPRVLVADLRRGAARQGSGPAAGRAAPASRGPGAAKGAEAPDAGRPADAAAREATDGVGRPVELRLVEARLSGEPFAAGRAAGERTPTPSRPEAPLPSAAEFRERLLPDLVRHAGIVLRDGGRGEIRLVLKPESLGSVRIRISLEDDRIEARFLVENRSVKELFEGNLEHLREALRGEGFETATLSVSVGGEQAREEGLPDGASAGRPAAAAPALERAVPLLAEWMDDELLVNLVV